MNDRHRTQPIADSSACEVRAKPIPQWLGAASVYASENLQAARQFSTNRSRRLRRRTTGASCLDGPGPTGPLNPHAVRAARPRVPDDATSVASVTTHSVAVNAAQRNYARATGCPGCRACGEHFEVVDRVSDGDAQAGQPFRGKPFIGDHRFDEQNTHLAP